MRNMFVAGGAVCARLHGGAVFKEEVCMAAFACNHSWCRAYGGALAETTSAAVCGGQGNPFGNNSKEYKK